METDVNRTWATGRGSPTHPSPAGSTQAKLSQKPDVSAPKILEIVAFDTAREYFRGDGMGRVHGCKRGLVEHMYEKPAGQAVQPCTALCLIQRQHRARQWLGDLARRGRSSSTIPLGSHYTQ